MIINPSNIFNYVAQCANKWSSVFRDEIVLRSEGMREMVETVGVVDYSLLIILEWKISSLDLMGIDRILIKNSDSLSLPSKFFFLTSLRCLQSDANPTSTRCRPQSMADWRLVPRNR